MSHVAGNPSCFVKTYDPSARNWPTAARILQENVTATWPNRIEHYVTALPLLGEFFFAYYSVTVTVPVAVVMVVVVVVVVVIFLDEC